MNAEPVEVPGRQDQRVSQGRPILVPYLGTRERAAGRDISHPRDGEVLKDRITRSSTTITQSIHRVTSPAYPAGPRP